MELSRIGIWDPRLRFGDEAEIGEWAAELEELGYGVLWFPDTGGDVFGALDVLLRATSRITVGPGILNLWMHSAAEAAAGRQALIEQHGRRLVIGVGVSHAPIVEAERPGEFKNPLAATASYLDALDAADPPIPAEERLLAALRPRMLAMARDRCAGGFSYHMTPEHTERARAVLGAGKLLVVEQAVVLDTDRDRARALAREGMAMYMGLPNYTNAWRWLGFSAEDLADGGSDHFVDAVVVSGDEDAIRRRVQAHRDAGADHVCVQALAADSKALLASWRALAPATKLVELANG
jgi:probable F420-dependent oxidoreductase